MHPEHPVVRTGRADYALQAALPAVRFVQAVQKPRNRSRADGYMAPDLDVSRPQFTGDDRNGFAGDGVLYAQKLRRQQFAEAPVQFRQRFWRCGMRGQSAPVDPELHFDMRPCFQLQVAPYRIVAVIARQGPLDVDRMRVMAFDQIAVIAVHRPDQVGKGRGQRRRQAPAEALGFRGQFQSEIVQRPAVS